jgi:hypothetical protein
MPLGMLISGVLDLVLKEILLLIVNVLLTVFRSKKLHGINGVIVTTDSMKMITLIVVYQLLIQLLMIQSFILLFAWIIVKVVLLILPVMLVLLDMDSMTIV